MAGHVIDCCYGWSAEYAIDVSSHNCEDGLCVALDVQGFYALEVHGSGLIFRLKEQYRLD